MTVRDWAEGLDDDRLIETRTQMLRILDQATRHASVSSVIAAEVAELGFAGLRAPIKQVTALDTTIAYSKPLEDHVMPDEDKIIDAVRQVLPPALGTSA